MSEWFDSLEGADELEDLEEIFEFVDLPYDEDLWYAHRVSLARSFRQGLVRQQVPEQLTAEHRLSLARHVLQKACEQVQGDKGLAQPGLDVLRPGFVPWQALQGGL